jgi:hypothetical protein
VAPNPPWTWRCHQGNCLRQSSKSPIPGIGTSYKTHDECSLMCGRPTGPLWPKPNGDVHLGNQLLVIDATNVQFPPTPYSKTASLLSEMVKLFREEVRLMACNEQSCDVSDRPANYRSLQLRVQITLEYPNISNLEWNTDESYTVVVRECENRQKNLYSPSGTGQRRRSGQGDGSGGDKCSHHFWCSARLGDLDPADDQGRARKWIPLPP